MIEHAWSLLCQATIIDKDTNLISIINVIEAIKIAETPSEEKTLNAPIQFVSVWSRTNLGKTHKGESLYAFYSPSGELIKEVEHPVDLKKYERMRTRVSLGDMKLPDGSGKYEVKVKYRNNKDDEWRDVASIPLKIVFLEEAKAQE